jgi:hypothetical protein
LSGGPYTNSTGASSEFSRIIWSSSGVVIGLVVLSLAVLAARRLIYGRPATSLALLPASPEPALRRAASARLSGAAAYSQPSDASERSNPAWRGGGDYR